MSNLETLETVEAAEAYSEPGNVITMPVKQRAEQSEQRSGSFRRIVQRFVAWIDSVDVDGQQYWN